MQLKLIQYHVQYITAECVLHLPLGWPPTEPSQWGRFLIGSSRIHNYHKPFVRYSNFDSPQHTVETNTTKCNQY